MERLRGIMIKAEVRMSKGVFMDFCNFISYQQGLKPYIIIGVPVLFLLIGIVSSIIASIYYGIVFLVLGILVSIMYCLTASFAISRTKKTAKFDDSKIAYAVIFGEDIEWILPEGSRLLEWTSFKKIYDVPKYYYLFLDLSNIIIIPKDNITIGQADDLSGMFRSKSGKNYVRKEKLIFGFIGSKK